MLIRKGKLIMLNQIKLDSKKDFYYLFEELFHSFGFRIFEKGLSQLENPDRYETITKIKNYIEKKYKVRDTFYCLSYENAGFDNQKFEILDFNETCAYQNGLITWMIKFENNDILYFARPEEIFYIDK